MRISVRDLRNVVREVAETPAQDDFVFRKWEDYTKKEQIASIYSDVFKEMYGVRPRHVDWDELTDEQAQVKLDQLYAWQDEDREMGNDHSYNGQFNVDIDPKRTKR